LRPSRRSLVDYVLDADGRYCNRAADATGIYRSKAIEGFWLGVEWLWQEPSPQGRRVLTELSLL